MLSAAVALLPVLLGACGRTGGPSSSERSFELCMRSFERASKFQEPQLHLEEALYSCEKLADWWVAAKAHPKVVEQSDSVRLLASLCASAPKTLMDGRLCKEAFIAHPQLAPAPARQ